jgi:threonylcarbamoyladenosine tRNA methylthiotransferase MtaB
MMNRHYTSTYYRNLIKELREAMPDSAIGADVLIGFPGEDESDFKKTIDLIEELPITYIHAFPFSPRPGTVAAAMNYMVPKKEKIRRRQIITNLGNKKRQDFYNLQVGKIFECLVEQRDKETSLWRGLTPNYIPVLIETDSNQIELKNQVLPIKITKIERGIALGRLQDSDFTQDLQ